MHKPIVYTAVHDHRSQFERRQKRLLQAAWSRMRHVWCTWLNSGDDRLMDYCVSYSEVWV